MAGKKLVDGKVSQLEKGHRNNSILNFGLKDRKDEGYFDTLALTKIIREPMKLNRSIDYVTRLRRRRSKGKILVKFSPFSVKLVVLSDTKNPVLSQIRADEDHSLDTVKKRRGLIPFLKLLRNVS
jgi:hypothetical protein